MDHAGGFALLLHAIILQRAIGISETDLAFCRKQAARG
jgi:hypothetical protein